MATERQPPDAVLEQTNLTGGLADIDEDPDSPDTNWMVATGNNVNTDVRVSFATPTGSPTVGADLQEFKAFVRQFDEGQTGTPTARIELWENGVLVRAGTDADVPQGGLLLSFTWNANELGTPDGSLVEMKVVGTKAGGGPSARNTVDVGAVEWNVTYDAGAVVELSGASAGIAGVSGAVSVMRHLIGSSAGIATGSSALSVMRRLIGASAGIATAVGVLTTAVVRELSGATAGAASVSGALSVVRRLVGASAGIATATGTLTTGVVKELSGTTAGAASVGGAIHVLRTLVGASAGVAGATGVLKVVRRLIGASGGAALVVGALAVDRTLAGASAGVATASGVLSTGFNNARFGATPSDQPLGIVPGPGTPAHSAPEGTLYWDSTNRKLYINYDSGTGWTLIGPP